jgi:predicted hydrolase (HD superfamily)
MTKDSAERGQTANYTKEKIMPYATKLTRDEALELLKKYNKDEFHIRHALIVEGVMRYFARELGYADDEDFWSVVGLLHDIDFEEWPDEHCEKAPELLREAGPTLPD